MEIFLKFLRKNGWALWAGGAITPFAGIGITDVGWWLYVIPLALLVTWMTFAENK